jgi:transglutaminase superfamily protein
VAQVAHHPMASHTKLALGLEILATYGRVRWLLWRGDLVSTLERLREQAAVSDVRPGGLDALSEPRLANAVSRTLRILPTDSRCLMRSLVLSSLLARRRIDSSLVIGVRPAPSFAAHAWVEQRGEALLPAGDEEYRRLVEL